uniref:Envelope glycoprotein n=1 Tax=Bombali virus TaxID=2010960 RepID=A0A343EQG4_9MONO|nr:virion spike glycoprotein precursor [Bombali ebolavirus]
MILQVPEKRHQRTVLFIWLVILFQRAVSVPLGVIHNSTLQVSDIDKLVCHDKLTSTNQLRSIGLNLEGNGIATDVPSATKRWGFRAGVPPKVVGYEAGEWAENCYNLEIKKPDGSECLPMAPEGIRGFPRCRYVHKVSGTGPCESGFAFHKEGAFFLYDRLASTIIYRGTTFAEGVVAFIILPKAEKNFLQPPLTQGPTNTTNDPSSMYHSTTLEYETTRFGTNRSAFWFKVDNLTFVQLESRFTPQFLVELNETIYIEGKRSNTTGRLIWQVNSRVDTDVGEWAFWENKKNLKKSFPREELSLTAVPRAADSEHDAHPPEHTPGPDSNPTINDNTELVTEDPAHLVQLQRQGRKEILPTPTPQAIEREPPAAQHDNPRNSPTPPSPIESDITGSTQAEDLTHTDDPSTINSATEKPLPEVGGTTQVPRDPEDPRRTQPTPPTGQPEQPSDNTMTPGQIHSESAAPMGERSIDGPGLLTNTLTGVARLITGAGRAKRESPEIRGAKCNPNLHYWTTHEESAAAGLAWIPYFGPAAEGIYTEGLMQNQNELICGPRQLANETTQALQLFLRSTTELRTFSILNRKAIDFLLQRWGGTCRILGPDCCIDPHDWTKNITDRIDQIIHDFVDKPLPDQSNNDNWWTGWRQWIPAGIGVVGVIAAFIALICICKIIC